MTSWNKSHRKRTSQSVPAVGPEAIIDSMQIITVKHYADM